VPRGGRHPAQLAEQGKGSEHDRLLEPVGRPAQARRHDLLRPRTAGDFTPQANDGEVQAFELWPVARFETVRDSNQFKYNCNLVLIDFFVRHGLLSADDPDFAVIVTGLRQTRP
jgi:hypothetical protein